MATFVSMIGAAPGDWECDFSKSPVHWPAGYFHEDPRFRRTHEWWQDWVGAMSGDELREFREAHSLHGRDRDLDGLLDNDWDGWMLVRCGEWES